LTTRKVRRDSRVQFVAMTLAAAETDCRRTSLDLLRAAT
jgi:hypothetical protein